MSKAKHKVDVIEELFKEFTDELFNTDEPFNKLVFLEKAPPEFNKENKMQTDRFRRLVGAYLPLHHCDWLLDVRKTLVEEFPYAIDIIDTLLKPSFKRVSVGKKGVIFEPTIIVGEPGLGKTRLLKRLLEELEVKFSSVSVAGIQDDQLFGVNRGFATAMPSLPTHLISEHEIGNPVIILDEIDKADRTKQGWLQHKLLGVLERDEAMNFMEPYLGVPVNLIYVGWLMTANTLESITEPLLSRCRVLTMPVPNLQHVPKIINQIKKEIAIEDGVDERFYAGFDYAEKEALLESYQKHKSIRVLKRQVIEILSLRKLTLQ